MKGKSIIGGDTIVPETTDLEFVFEASPENDPVVHLQSQLRNLAEANEMAVAHIEQQFMNTWSELEDMFMAAIRERYGHDDLMEGAYLDHRQRLRQVVSADRQRKRTLEKRVMTKMLGMAFEMKNLFDIDLKHKTDLAREKIRHVKSESQAHEEKTTETVRAAARAQVSNEHARYQSIIQDLRENEEVRRQAMEKALREELDFQYQETIEKLEKQERDLLGSVGGLRNEVEELKRRIAQLMQERATQATIEHSLTTENHKLKSTVGELSINIDDLREEFKRQSVTLTSLLDALNLMRSHYGLRKVTVNEAVGGDLNDYKDLDAITNLEQLLQEKTERILQLKENTDALTAQLGTSQTENAELRKEIEALRTQANKARKQATQAQVQLSKLKDASLNTPRKKPPVRKKKKTKKAGDSSSGNELSDGGSSTAAESAAMLSARSTGKRKPYTSPPRSPRDAKPVSSLLSRQVGPPPQKTAPLRAAVRPPTPPTQPASLPDEDEDEAAPPRPFPKRELKSSEPSLGREITPGFGRGMRGGGIGLGPGSGLRGMDEVRPGPFDWLGKGENQGMAKKLADMPSSNLRSVSPMREPLPVVEEPPSPGSPPEQSALNPLTGDLGLSELMKKTSLLEERLKRMRVAWEEETKKRKLLERMKEAVKLRAKQAEARAKQRPNTVYVPVPMKPSHPPPDVQRTAKDTISKLELELILKDIREHYEQKKEELEREFLEVEDERRKIQNEYIDLLNRANARDEDCMTLEDRLAELERYLALPRPEDLELITMLRQEKLADADRANRLKAALEMLELKLRQVQALYGAAFGPGYIPHPVGASTSKPRCDMAPLTFKQLFFDDHDRCLLCGKYVKSKTAAPARRKDSSPPKLIREKFTRYRAGMSGIWTRQADGALAFVDESKANFTAAAAARRNRREKGVRERPVTSASTTATTIASRPEASHGRRMGFPSFPLPPDQTSSRLSSPFGSEHMQLSHLPWSVPEVTGASLRPATAPEVDGVGPESFPLPPPRAVQPFSPRERCQSAPLDLSGVPVRPASRDSFGLSGDSESTDRGGHRRPRSHGAGRNGDLRVSPPRYANPDRPTMSAHDASQRVSRPKPTLNQAKLSTLKQTKSYEVTPWSGRQDIDDSPRLGQNDTKFDNA